MGVMDIIMDNRALCELCRRVQNGETLTAEAIEQYKLGKMSLNGSISFVNMSQFQAQKKAEKGDKFTLRSLGGRIMHAIGLAPEPVAELESTKIAKQKRRLRIFSQGQLDQVVSSGTTSLGTMTGIDAEIRKKKEQG